MERHADDDPTGRYYILPEEIVPTKRYKTPGNGIILRCPVCDGRGRVLHETATMYFYGRCDACDGTGILKGTR